MSGIGIIPKQRLEAQLQLMKELQDLCESSGVFKDEQPEELFIYTTFDERTSYKKEVMLAVAKYRTTYAIHAPRYIEGRQWEILRYLLQRVEQFDQIVVFSEEAFFKVKKYNIKKSISVRFVI